MGSAATPDEIGLDAIAAEVGVQRRTIFRHFENKEELLRAFWPWLNARIGASTKPETPQDILEGPRQAFPLFDTHEDAIRAALHSRTGRQKRAGTIEDRRRNFSAALAPTLVNASPEQGKKFEALSHLLYSASAWEVLKDYGGLDGSQAGGTASWALKLILSAINSGRDCGAAASGTPPHTHEAAELLYVLEGELTVRQFGPEMPPITIKAGPGTSVKIQSRVPHNYVNESDKPVRMLVMLEASMVAFFRDIGSAEQPSGAPDFARIGAAMERHGIEALASAA